MWLKIPAVLGEGLCTLASSRQEHPGAIQQTPLPFPAAPGVTLTQRLSLQPFQSLALILINCLSKERCGFC